MDIQVGDRITYKSINEPNYQARYKIITDENDILKVHNCVKEEQIEILKIERPKYKVVKEKKKLLTEEEKEFLKQCKKINNDIGYVQRFKNRTYLVNKDKNENIFILNDIYKNLFKNLKEGHGYTLKELGLEEN